MSGFGWGLVLLGSYVLLVMLARWIYIARVNVVWTNAQARAMVARISFQLEHDSTGAATPAAQATMQQLLTDIEKKSPNRGRSGVLGWNGSHQIGQWVLMHEAERLALPALSHVQLTARLERALGQLDELPLPRREAWEATIQDLVTAREGGDDTGQEQLNHVYRAYLDELLGEIYETSNGNATLLAGLYNRSVWVILVALLPLSVLAGLGYSMLLLAGAIGGLVSRMQRLVFSTRIPVSYGSSWTPLFCAPILGALAAWSGLVLISLLQTAGVLKLTALQTSVDSLQAPSTALLGTALLLGISERFLLRLEQQAESIIDPGHTGPPAHAAATSAVAAAHQAYLPPPAIASPPSRAGSPPPPPAGAAPPPPAAESPPLLAGAPAMDPGGNGHAIPVGSRAG